MFSIWSCVNGMYFAKCLLDILKCYWCLHVII